MAFIGILDNIGSVDLTIVDLLPPGPANLVGTAKSGRSAWMGLIVPAYDSVLGGGEFMYASVPTTTAILPGTWCEFTYSLDSSAQPVVSAAAWAGTASTPKVLGIMYPGVSSITGVQYCWFQVGGIAMSRTAGAPAQSNPVAWNASGVVQPTLVATKNVLGAEYVTAVSTQIGTNTGAYAATSTNGFLLSATQALVHVNRPTSSAA